jgi:putative membrane protein
MYMQMAASSDLFEIQSSQLALQMSQNPAVQAMAQMLIADHTRMSNEMRLAAATAGLPLPPPALLPQHAQMLEQLRTSQPFDLAFRDIQIAAHQQALQLHQNYASGGDHPALRAVAARAVPVVQGHLSHAQTLAAPPPTGEVQPARSGERG